MSSLRRIMKSLLPASIRELVRDRYREFAFRQAMRRYLRSPAACVKLGDPILAELIHSWGNESWSSLEEYLVACLQLALTTPGPILECGSGLSTLLVGEIATRRNLSHWVLEHDSAWAVRVQQYLKQYDLSAVNVSVRPLRSYGEFSWYDPPLESMPTDFSMVICDGPPSDTPGGRYGLVPVLAHRLRSDCVILLDDAQRHEECVIAGRWQKELGGTLERFGTKKPYIRLTVPNRR